MSFNDDDPIGFPPDSGPRPTVPGRIQLEIRNNCKVPLEENNQKVLLEFSAEENRQLGLDLVVVLDVSSSMEGDKLAKMKKAMLFLMKKLSLIDHLSIVKYSFKAKRLCPLHQMTESSQRELKNLIIGLETQPGTNITDGLETALNVIKNRSVSSPRVGVIMLMSDGEQNLCGDAADVPIGNVPVYTFGFGEDQNLKVLKAIAQKTQLEGTYWDCRTENLMRLAFSQCLGQLQDVIAQDLAVTVNEIKNESRIKQVTLGSYLQSIDNAAGSVTITVGDIYIQDVRKVLVDLLLPAINRKQGADVLRVSYSYKFFGELFEANPAVVTVCRMSGLAAEELKDLPEVRSDVARVLLANVIKQAIAAAEKGDMESAQEKIVNGLKTLWDEDIEKSKTELKTGLLELLRLMQTQEIYKMHGRRIAYSLLVSLVKQYQTERGNNIGDFQLFDTHATQEILEEAKNLSFNNDDLIVPPDSGPQTTVPGQIQLVIRNNCKVPLEENNQKVLLEFSVGNYERLGLDLVAVLDVSSSMEGDKLAKMKIAMIYLMKKLSVIDHLSIVQYSFKAKRLCPLHQMTKSSKRELENLIIGLKTQPGTNITDGLETALNVLKNRSVSSARVGVIMLMSDGEQNLCGDAADVPVGNVPVYTFGFGEDQNLKVLKNIAQKSQLGGTYWDCRMENLMRLAISRCLGLSHNLTVTVNEIQNESRIMQVSPRSYPQSMDNAAGSVTITIGDICIQEVRKVLVDLLLPAINRKQDADVLEISYSHKFFGKLFEANPVIVTVCRMSGLTAEEQQDLPEVRLEVVHPLLAKAIKQAIVDAEKGDMESAEEKLVNGLKILWDENKGKLKTKLKAGLVELLKLMQTQEIYKKHGRRIAYSLLVSLLEQYQTEKGNNIGDFQLFDTQAMQEFLEEAKNLNDYKQYIIDPFPMSFNNNDQIVLPPDSGGLKLGIVMNRKAPLETNNQKVLLELSTIGTGSSPLDIVAVLDVSNSMKGDNLEKMKKTMLYLMKKLNTNDRLAIVEFSWQAKRLCQLCQITESSKEKLENLIKGLKVHPGTNITDGLEMALNVLNDGSVIGGRVSIIMLMSDGKQNIGGDATDVSIYNMKVQTFGFGEDHNSKVLMAIANKNWLGGTYTEVCMDNLDLTFSNFLDEMQNVVALDLAVTVTQIKNESTINKVSAGRYPLSTKKDADSVTITFGNVYIQEVRNLLVDLVLPVTNEERDAEILKVTYKYCSFNGEISQSSPTLITVRRMPELTSEEQQTPLEVTAHEVRLLIAELIKQATRVANKDVLKSVRDKLIHSLETLGDEHIEQWKAEIRNELELLRTELMKLSNLVQTQAKKEKQGRSFAYSLLFSHAAQHGLARSTNNTDKNQPFTTFAMGEFLQKAKMYGEIHDLHVYMHRFICAIECIEMIIDKV